MRSSSSNQLSSPAIDASSTGNSSLPLHPERHRQKRQLDVISAFLTTWEIETKMPNKWTIDQRTTLHLIHTNFTDLNDDTVATIFNIIYKEELAALGYPSGLNPDVIRYDYQGRNWSGRGTMYAGITAAKQSAETMARREDLLQQILVVAAIQGIELTPKEAEEGEVDGEAEEVEADAAAAEDKAMKTKPTLRGQRYRGGDNNLSDDDLRKPRKVKVTPLSDDDTEDESNVRYKGYLAIADRHLIPTGTGNRYSSAHADNHTDKIWVQHGSAWREGIPANLTKTNKIHIRIPTNAVTKKSGWQYIKQKQTPQGAEYNAITSEHVDDVFEDRNNIRFRKVVKDFGGRVPRKVGGFGVHVISKND